MVGKGASIKGKTLSIKSVVTDVNDMTNHVSISYELTGGATLQTVKAEADVEHEGDSVIYRATINLVPSLTARGGLDGKHLSCANMAGTPSCPPGHPNATRRVRAVV